MASEQREATEQGRGPQRARADGLERCARSSASRCRRSSSSTCRSSRPTTPSLPALKAYALGIAERRKGRELESIAFFNRAIELDPEFAAAYTTLSTVYGSIGEWRRSEEYAQLAYARQKRVSERERLFITYQYHDRVTGNQDEAARTLELWKTAVSARLPAGRTRSR